MFKMIVFDMDGTLTPSKSKMDDEMINLIKKLLTKYKVWVISWWDYPQFEKQFLSNLWDDENLLKNLYVCPTCSTKMYVYKNKNWEKLYSLDFSKEEVNHIINVLENAIEKLWLRPEKTYWKLIEDRWTQITYSASWQDTPLEIKSKWDPNREKRMKIREYIKDDLKWFDVLIGWSNSIDVTREWVDKAYWILKLIEITWINNNEIIFVWDAIFPWWNDYPPLEKLWTTSKKVFSIDDTKDFIKEMLK